MADIPLALLMHRVGVTPFVGTTSSGDTFGTQRTLACLTEGKTQVIRNSVGEEKVSNLTLYTSPAEVLHERDLITAGNTRSRVISILPHTDGGLGAWQHLEVLCE